MKVAAMVLAVVVAAVNVAAEGKTQWAQVTEGRLEITTPEFQLPQADGPPLVPLRHTDVVIQVRGCVAEVTVTQQFENALDRPIEAEYVFPLPHEAAVNATEMQIGDRIVCGRIDRRDKARAAYEQARDQGQRASLLEQERPNIFTQSVANIGPGEPIDVRIRYVQTLAYSDGCYEVVFPMVVGPRYIPGSPVVDSLGGGPVGHGRLPDTDQVSDASRITPQVLAPGQRCGHDIQVTVDIDVGVPICDIRSRAHQVAVQRSGETTAIVTLDEQDRIPNKDFVLEVEVAGEQPEVGWLAHHDGQDGYFILVLQPPKVADAELIRPREIVCVLDCSGSMRGRPLHLSQLAARRLLAQLRPSDRFNILSFSTCASAFSSQALPATPANVEAGLAYVTSLRAGGGTEMMTGVTAALSTPAPEECLRIAAFFTDGYIGNERAVLAATQRLLRGARLFSFGIGSSVNRYLLDRMAVVGRGSVQYVLLDDSPEEAADTFVRRLAGPILTDVRIDFGGVEVRDMVPACVPDVFDGRPVYVYGRYSEPGEATLEVLGYIGIEASAAKVDVSLPGPDGSHSPLPSIWARQKIKELEVEQLGASSPAAIEQQITELALTYSLMSEYTSFVAVDETSTTTSGQPEFVPVSVPMPEGVSYETTVQWGPSTSGHTGSGLPFGGGPIGPFGLAVVGVIGMAEWIRRRRRACAQ